MHRLLLDGILTGVSQKQYGRELRVGPSQPDQNV